MDLSRIAPFLLAGAALAQPALAHPRALLETPAELVAVTVEIDGQPTSLYPAPDGSGRFYLEARQGCRYAVLLANRTGERVGVVLTVDGLNAISGARDTGRGRMYVLDPWQRTTVQGWRTSLQDVRRFTFVDEQASYAARSGKANEKMGWIEVAVYRERRPFLNAVVPPPPPRPEPYEAGRDSADKTEAPAQGAQRDAPEPMATPLPGAAAEARSYPGTGWGPRADDPVVLVTFDAQSEPSQRVTLRYEYRPALVALGVLPRWEPPSRDRLWERERAQKGFAQPPLW
jgi:hypothetical protein